MSTTLIAQLNDLMTTFGVELTPAQRAQAAAKFSPDVSAASSTPSRSAGSSKKFLISDQLEAASSSDQLHIRSAMKFARGVARRNGIDLDCNEDGLNNQLSKSRMSVDDRMAMKQALYAAGAIAR